MVDLHPREEEGSLIALRDTAYYFWGGDAVFVLKRKVP
jgi:hypothetical protein